MTARAASLAEVADHMDVAAQQLAGATRRFSAGQWNRAGGGHSVASAVQALVTLLAELDHAVVTGSAPPPTHWRSPAPAPYHAALPDRIALVAHDLASSLRAAPPSHQVWYAAELVPVEQLAALALAEVRSVADYAARR